MTAVATTQAGDRDVAATEAARPQRPRSVRARQAVLDATNEL
ncbi:MAG: hypothetical protein QOE32_1344, partial [Pseudonocardiales bacterium]|nr:hypothetical protein [Pseudonocardiales bacterium]